MSDWRNKLPDQVQEKRTKELMDKALEEESLQAAQDAYREAYSTLEEVNRRLMGKASLGQQGQKTTLSSAAGSVEIELSKDGHTVVVRVDGQEVDKVWWYNDGKRLKNTKDNLRSVDQLIGNLAADKFKG